MLPLDPTRQYGATHGSLITAGCRILTPFPWSVYLPMPFNIDANRSGVARKASELDIGRYGWTDIEGVDYFAFSSWD